MSEPLRVGVLVSGTGTNLQALIDQVHGREAVIVGVLSGNPSAPAMERAQAAGIETAAFPRREHPARAERDLAMAAWLVERGCELVILAGFMELLTLDFLGRFPGRVINVHPSLLPAFPGLHAVEQAFDYGVKVFGVTVHFVDEGTDTGPVILQRAVELPDARDPDAVLAALRPLEHALLPEAVRLVAADALSFDPERPRRVRARTGD